MNYIILNGTEPVKISDAKASLFQKLLNKNEVESIQEDLNLIHEIALYSSVIPFDKTEKAALFTLKTLIENLT
jgi:hypothetical protein